jgi:hypothetical protein
MGNIPSASEVSEQELQYTAFDDAEILQYSDELLRDEQV